MFSLAALALLNSLWLECNPREVGDRRAGMTPLNFCSWIGAQIVTILIPWTGFTCVEPVCASAGPLSHSNDGGAGGEKTVGMGLRNTERQPFCCAFCRAYCLFTVRMESGRRLGHFVLLSRAWAFALEWRLYPDISRGLVAKSAFIYGHVRKLESRGEALFYRGEEIQGPKHGAGLFSFIGSIYQPLPTYAVYIMVSGTCRLWLGLSSWVQNLWSCK